MLSSGEKSREAVLALPLSRLLVKMVRVPESSRDDPASFAAPILQAMSPYPDEPLRVSCETVREIEDGVVVLAAALPESAVDDIADALDAAKLNITRVDALALGALRGLWGVISAKGDFASRRLILLDGADCISMIVLDGDMPSAVRAVDVHDDLRREAMLSLLEAEDFGGSKPLAEIVCIGNVDASQLVSMAAVRKVEIGEDAAMVGVAERSLDPTALNALPDSWREVLEETRFKSKLIKGLAVAGTLWALVMLVLFGVPIVYGFMEDHQKTLCKEHSRQYREVREMKEKTELVRKYSDHTRGALEIMKAVSDRLPQGVTLGSWNFKRGEGVKFSGEADSAELVYRFKDALDSIALTAEDGEEADDAPVLFGSVQLTGPSARGTKQKFDIDCRYTAYGEETE